MPDNDHSNSKTTRTTVGVLYVVATPIGNLEDITMRAVRILQEVQLIAAEDTRHTRKLLNSLKITAPLLSYYKGKEQERATLIIDRLLGGDTIALVSDAGTPAISDPGHILVHRARQAGIQVVPIPGPSALTAALSVAGLDETPFVFLGFLPSRKKQRRTLLKSLASRQEHLVFFEAPHRLPACLSDCREILGNRQGFWGRELTKMHEETRTGSLTDFEDRARQRTVKGESVLILQGAAAEPGPGIDDLQELLRWYRDNTDHTLKDVVQRLAVDLGLNRTQVYKQALLLWGKTDHTAHP